MANMRISGEKIENLFIVFYYIFHLFCTCDLIIVVVAQVSVVGLSFIIYIIEKRIFKTGRLPLSPPPIAAKSLPSK